MSTKKIILIIVGIVSVTAVIVGRVLFNSPWACREQLQSDTYPKNTVSTTDKTNKCGDGICDAQEKSNPKLCPQDCNVSMQIETCGQDDQGYCIDFKEKCKTGFEGIGHDKCKHGKSAQCCMLVELSAESFSELSYSFGVHPSGANEYTYAKDLGIDFNREGTYFVWNWSDINRDGNFSFKKAIAPPHPDRPESKGGQINYDKNRERLVKVVDITLMNNICPFRGGRIPKDEFRNAEEEAIYREFVEKLVERYDGDSNLGCTQDAPDCYNLGDGEYPNQSFIDTLQTNPIKYWQVCNKVDDTCSGKECKDNNNYAVKHAKVQKLTYLGVKASCPECQVLIAGDSRKEMYPPVYEALEGKYVDIIDKHFFGEENDYVAISEEMAYLKDSLQNAGFNLDKLKFWITETGTYSGDPAEEPGRKDLPYQSEAQQAQGLVKRFAVAFGEGIEKVLWAWGIIEGFGCDCCIFDYTGFIYDGNIEPQTCDANDPYDRGAGVKKLVYYSFKLLTDKIGDFTNVERIQDSENYVYKFTKNNKPIYIVWNDNGGSVTLTNINSDSVKITKAVPDAESGADLDKSDYPNFFETEVKAVSNDKITITLGESPVFVELVEVEAPEELTCSLLNGNICSTNEICLDSWLSASDNERCCSGVCQTTASLTLQQIIDETRVSPKDGQYGRVEVISIDNRLFMALNNKDFKTFHLIELNKDLSFKSPSYNLFSNSPKRDSIDIRLASDGENLWYAFESLLPNRSVDCKSRFLNIAKYDISNGKPDLTNYKIDIATGCPMTLRRKEADELGIEIPNNPELLDDPTPLFYNGKYVVLTRAWEGSVQHIRTFDQNFNLIEDFTINLKNMLGNRELSQNSLVVIKDQLYLIGGLRNGAPAGKDSDSYISAIPLSENLKYVNGEEIKLLINPNKYYMKVTSAKYVEGKLYINYVKAGDGQFQHLGVFDVGNNFASLAQIQFHDESVNVNHASIEVIGNKVYVFYPEDDHGIPIILGKVFEWQEDNEDPIPDYGDLTEAVPYAESGADLNENDYPNFFKTETKTVVDDEVTIILGESPVFVEEITATP